MRYQCFCGNPVCARAQRSGSIISRVLLRICRYTRCLTQKIQQCLHTHAHPYTTKVFSELFKYAHLKNASGDMRMPSDL